MYIIELISVLTKKIKNRDFKFLEKKPQALDINEQEEKCEHIFVPIDSTKKVPACSKCGYLVKVDLRKIKKSNPFNTKN